MSATYGIRISGLKFSQSSTASRRPIASFNLEFLGVEIIGCELIRTAKDGLVVKMPRSCILTDARVHSLIKRMAAQGYHALGGADLPEWARRSPSAPVAIEAA